MLIVPHVKSTVNPKLQALISRVRKATSKHGERVKLADYLGVPKQTINDWLSGRVSPNGETTLRLLAWVAKAEAKKQNARNDVSSTAADLTHSTQHSHEKIKQVRKRR